MPTLPPPPASQPIQGPDGSVIWNWIDWFIRAATSYVERANHTGTQVASTISDFDTASHLAMINANVTGVITGGRISATAGGTTFSITDGTGWIVDNFTTPGTGTITNVSWTGKTGITDSFLTDPATYVYIDSTGAVFQTVTPPEPDVVRDKILIGVLAHSSSTIIASACLVTAAYQNGFLAHDMLLALGAITTGCTYRGNAALTLARASGSILRKGAHYLTDLKSPNEVTLAAQNPVQFASYCRNGSNTVFSASSVGTTLTVNRYDDGTAAAAGVPNGVVNNNQWQAIRIYLSTNGFSLLQYGQTVYTKLSDAIAGVGSETHFQAPITTLTAFRGYLFVRGGATDLSLSSDAFFQAAGKLGDAGTLTSQAAIGVGGGTYTPTLTNTTNVAASTAYSCQWMQADGSITVSGRIDLDPTAAGQVVLGISLPVPSALTASNECAGTAVCPTVAGQAAAILGDATNDRATLEYIAVDVTNQPFYFTFTYRIL